MSDRVNDERRILIAETIGRDSGCYAPNYDIPIFDPFTDANDDYAVLEWAHEQVDSGAWEPRGKWATFADELFFPTENYKIGDYARAALKVIE